MKSTSAILAAALVGSSSAITGFTPVEVAVGGAVAVSTLDGFNTANYVCFTAAQAAAATAATCAAGVGTATDITADAGGCSAIGAASLVASTSTNLYVSVIECTATTTNADGNAQAGTLAYSAAVATVFASGSPLTAGTASNVVITTTGLGVSTGTAGLFLSIVEGTCATPTKTIAAGAAVTATSTIEGTISITAAVGKATAAGRICTSATVDGAYADLVTTPKTDFAVNDAVGTGTVASAGTNQLVKDVATTASFVTVGLLTVASDRIQVKLVASGAACTTAALAGSAGELAQTVTGTATAGTVSLTVTAAETTGATWCYAKSKADGSFADGDGVVLTTSSTADIVAATNAPTAAPTAASGNSTTAPTTAPTPAATSAATVTGVATAAVATVGLVLATLA